MKLSDVLTAAVVLASPAALPACSAPQVTRTSACENALSDLQTATNISELRLRGVQKRLANSGSSAPTVLSDDPAGDAARNVYCGDKERLIGGMGEIIRKCPMDPEVADIRGKAAAQVKRIEGVTPDRIKQEVCPSVRID